jgi:hypothetical protein
MGAQFQFKYNVGGYSCWRSDCLGSQADIRAPTQAPTRYAEVGNVVEVGDEEEAENKAQTSLRDAGPPGSARAIESMVLPPVRYRMVGEWVLSVIILVLNRELVRAC